jgi:hypothetical protein
MALNYPTNWDKGWQWPLQIGAGGKEEPYLKDGKWKLRVWDAKAQKHYIYDFASDMLGIDEALQGGWFKSCKNCKHPADEHEADDGCQHKGCRCMELKETYTRKANRQLNEAVGPTVQQFIQNVAKKEFATASEQFSRIMQSKIATRLAQERQNIGGTLVKEALHESQMPTSEVQRVYDTTHNIEETEILCGVRSLKVNDKGQVVSFVTESKLNEELWHWFVIDKWDDETVVDEIVATDLKGAEEQAVKNLGKDWKRFYYLDGGPGKGK